MLKYKLTVCIYLALLVTPLEAQAPSELPSELPGDPNTPPADTVPLSGIELLLAAGGLFGAKKYWDIRRKK